MAAAFGAGGITWFPLGEHDTSGISCILSCSLMCLICVLQVLHVLPWPEGADYLTRLLTLHLRDPVEPADNPCTVESALSHCIASSCSAVSGTRLWSHLP